MIGWRYLRVAREKKIFEKVIHIEICNRFRFVYSIPCVLFSVENVLECKCLSENVWLWFYVEIILYYSILSKYRIHHRAHGSDSLSKYIGTPNSTYFEWFRWNKNGIPEKGPSKYRGKRNKKIENSTRAYDSTNRNLLVWFSCTLTHTHTNRSPRIHTHWQKATTISTTTNGNDNNRFNMIFIRPKLSFQIHRTVCVCVCVTRKILRSVYFNGFPIFPRSFLAIESLDIEIKIISIWLVKQFSKMSNSIRFC